MSAENNRGALLAELLLALALVTITLVVVASMFPFAYRADQKAWTKSGAQSVCASTVEQLKGADFDSIVAENRTVQKGDTTYRLEIEVSDHLPPTIKRKSVICRVKWETQSGIESFQQTFSIARYGR